MKKKAGIMLAQRKPTEAELNRAKAIGDWFFRWGAKDEPPVIDAANDRFTKLCALFEWIAVLEGEYEDALEDNRNPQTDQALRLIREATGDAVDGAGIVEAVAILISQRDNARHYVDTFRAKLKELGYQYV